MKDEKHSQDIVCDESQVHPFISINGLKPRRILRLLLSLCLLLTLCTVWYARQMSHSYFISWNNAEDHASVSPTYARQLAPIDLLRRKSDQPGYAGVPRVIHQSWGASNLTEQASAWSMTWRLHNADWEWVLWRDEDNRLLVQERFPWFLKVYDALGSNIKRADAARNLYMYAFGGMYTDFDLECLRSIDALFERYIDAQASNQIRKPRGSLLHKQTLFAFFGRMGQDKKFIHSIPNDWMASSRGHPFFLLPILNIMEQIQKDDSRLGPEWITGPVALRSDVLRYQKTFSKDFHQIYSHLEAQSLPLKLERVEHKLILLDQSTIHPFAWSIPTADSSRDLCLAYKSTFDPEACKKALDVYALNAYAITYWAHSWSPGTGS